MRHVETRYSRIGRASIGLVDCEIVVQPAAAFSASARPALHTTLPDVYVSEKARAKADPRPGASPRLVGVDAQQVIGGAHLLSASLVGFARGLNDTPKILGLMLGLGISSPKLGALAIAAAMALGGWLAARRVADTLATKITPMTPAEGLAGNLATSLLVVGASRLGLPVSTTHVSTGGIFGIGAASGRLHRRMASEVVLAWVVTLPVAAALAAGLIAIALHWGTG